MALRDFLVNDQAIDYWYIERNDSNFCECICSLAREAAAMVIHGRRRSVKHQRTYFY